MNKLLSLIVPVFNEEEVLPVSYARMSAAMQALTGYDYEIIYVNDGSRDGTMKQLRAIAKEHKEVRVISFSRNFGHQLAVTAGMDNARGDALIIIDADLQDPPEVIAELVKAWENGADIAYGKRLKREGETVFKKLTAFCYYRLLNAMSAYPIPLDTGDFRLLDKKVADVFLKMREHNRFLRGMSGWMGFDAVPVEYVRHERQAGKTKYTLKKMLRLAFDGILGFSYKPMSLALYAGAALGVTGMLGLIALIIIAATIGCAPWLWAVDGLVLINALTLAAIGVQGAYLNRIYDEVRGRPLYIAAETINLDR
ncbi:MAG: glycosyltransferase family 2 protein [Christensenellaceae bacterium]|nr:glycosyltransferase family 2 protein [Christensenellaceae bacterium]MCI6943073.1 glycosyltransferase family 2 protein [Christensenellaceae bacterium]MDD7495861.1 glycosyltransferase family 2 protein [Christensenellaceae bacterium]MDY3974905.1 glycosyltransferase family 2 protein [Eubacteriales bacterium]MDY5719048.1 glycosyltransferase family 2 protein [Eubacteriales bacterium]